MEINCTRKFCLTSIAILLLLLSISLWGTYSIHGRDFTFLSEQGLLWGNVDERTTEDPNITRSFSIHRRLQKRALCNKITCPEEQGTGQFKPTTNPDVQVTCVNPTITRVDECLEGMDKKVAETCLPGILKVLHLPEESSVLEQGYNIEADKSETCLRYVFSHCSYDSRFRVKTKITKHTGISLDIAFQDEFEMDSCNSETMEEVSTNVEECLQREVENFKPTREIMQKKNVSTEILNYVGQCIEDHTAFSCVMKDKSLFNKFVQRLVQYSKSAGLKILDMLSKGGNEPTGCQKNKVDCEKYNYTRLCFKWMDYSRLESCEQDFFQYMLYLMNGKSSSAISQKMYSCYQEHLKVCPRDTVQTLITILAGAVEGKSGEEPEQGEETLQGPEKPITILTPLTKSDQCGQKIMNHWVQDLKKCFTAKVRTPTQNKNHLQRYGMVMANCASEIRSADCTVHKASQFTEIAMQIMRLVLDNKPDSQVSDEDQACLKDIENPKVKDCVANLFLHFVSVNHAHYTPEAREKLLNKAKLCFQVTLKNCPFKTFIVKLIQTFAVVFRIKVPQLSKGEIMTRVTIPEGYVWCETRIITKDVPIPPTRQIGRTPKPLDYSQQQTASTIQKRVVTVTRGRFTKSQTAPLPVSEIFKPPPKFHTAIMMPTTTRVKRYTLPITHRWKEFSPKPTRIIDHLPRTRTPKKECLTPTTMLWKTLFPPTIRPEKEKPAPPTKFGTRRPIRFEITERIRPTTVISFKSTPPARIATRKEKIPPTKSAEFIPEKTEGKQHIKPTVVVTHHFPIPTLQRTKWVPPVPTKVDKFTPPRRTQQEEITPTTIIWRNVENTQVSQLDKHMPLPTVTRRFIPAPRTHAVERFPTTVHTYSIPRAKTTGRFKKQGTTFRFQLIEKREKVPVEKSRTYTPEVWISTPEGVCESPVERGLCKPCLDKYYFDKKTGKCKKFIFCGCGSSKNNFETQEQCQESCEDDEDVMKSDSGSVCLQPLEAGYCKPYYERYYFDVTIQQCRMFIWFGCEKNKNNFATYKECERRCGGRRTQTPTVSWRRTVTFPASEVERTRPAQVTEVFTRTRPTRLYHAIVTPATKRNRVFPLQFYFKLETRAPRPVKPQRRPTIKMIWRERRGSTTTYKLQTPPRVFYTEGRQPTSIRYKFIEIPIKPASKFKAPVTRVEAYTPRIEVFTERERPTPTKITRIPAQPKTRKEEMIKPTRKIHIRPSKPTIAQRIPQTTMQRFTFSRKKIRFRLTHPTVLPKEREMPGIVMVEKFRPTEVQTITIPAKAEEHTQAKIGTTLKVKFIELPGRTKEKTLELPSTAMFQIEGDVCKLPVTPGLCKPCHNKYYYDKRTRRCQKFTFCGCGENKNNFETQEECEKCCANNVGVEKGDSGSVCLQPIEHGFCKPYYQRYYFDVKLEQCKKFIWFGCAKNGNNFPSKVDCEKRCGVTQHVTVTPELKIYTPPSIVTRLPDWCVLVVKPVTRPDITAIMHKTPPLAVTMPLQRRPIPHIIYPKMTTKLYIIRPSRPPVQKFISLTPVLDVKVTMPRITKERTHPGATTLRVVWLEKEAPTKGGVITFRPPRVFTQPPPAITDVVRPILTREHIIPPSIKDDMISIPETQTKVFIKVKTPPVYTERKKKTTILFQKYPRTRSRFTYTVTPPTTEQIISYPPRHVCELPVKPGLCKPCVVRYYYDERTGKCKRFSFCGCGSNKNNFPTEEKCRKCCEDNAGVKKGDSGSVCLQPVEPGYCKPYYQRYYFDVNIKQCKAFIWFGCGKNGNNFPSKVDCEKLCEVTPEHRTRTTFRTERRTPPLTTHTQFREPTTMKYTEMELPEEVITWEEDVPGTKKQIFTPPTKATEDYVTRTTVRPITFPPLPPAITEGERPPPKTRYMTVFPPRTEQTRYLTHSTSAIYERTPGGIIWITRPAPVTKPCTVLPPRTPYTRIQTPTTTSVILRTATRPLITITMKPPRLTGKFITPQTRTESQGIPVTTRMTEIPAPSKGYECTYPTKKPYVTCKFVPQKCTDSILQKWIAKIRKCTKELLKEINKTLSDYIECVTDELKDIVLKCVRQIGDTSCRNTTFSLAEWVLEKELYVSGSLSERAEIGHEKSEDNYEVEQCVTLINEANLEKCFPGFYKALSDILVYNKDQVQIEIAKQQPTECIGNSMNHCSERTRKTIEKTVQSVIGKCISLLPGEKSICNKRHRRYLVDNSVDRQEQMNCARYLSLKELKERMNTCVSSKFSAEIAKLPTETVLWNSLKCFTIIADNTTCVKKESNEDYNLVLQLLLKFVDHYGIEDACKKNLQSGNAKICYRNILDVITNLHNIKDGNVVEILNKLVRCLNRGVTGCPEDAPRSLLTVLVLFWQNTLSTKQMIEELSLKRNSGNFFSTISSIKQSDTGMELCMSQFPQKFDDDGNPLRPNFPDECVAINDDTNEGEPFYVVLKSCSEEDSNKWLRMVKECVEEKAANIGFRDPDYLNIQRTEMILMNCVDQKGPLKCRAKYREDFRTILKTVFEMVRQNSLSEDNSECKTELKLENHHRCFQILHKYLVLSNEKDQLQSVKAKATSCLQNDMKSCSSEVSNSLLKVLELALIADAESIQTYYGNDVQSCSPGEFDEQSSQISDTPSFLICGAGGKLVKRSIIDVGDEKPLVSSEIGGPEQKACSAEEYKHYFDQLEKCSRRRLYLKFSRMKRKCEKHMMIEFWIAMTECMVENTEDDLTCSFETENQMFEYLYYVAKALHTNQQIAHKHCPSPPRCYGESAPKLHKCTEQYFKLLKARDSTDHMLEILKRTSKVLKCLSLLWPNCSAELSLMTLSFAYRPLGMNYDSTIKKGLKFASCRAEESQEDNFTFPDCVNLQNGNEIHQEKSENSIESCINCVRAKDGICSFKGINDVTQVINEDFSRLTHCFKNHITNDDCLAEITTRMKNKCVPAVYGFFKNLNKGIVLNAVESFWNFNQCLVDFSKSRCPDSFRRIAPEIYYEILGLSPYFKPLLEVFND